MHAQQGSLKRIAAASVALLLAVLPAAVSALDRVADGIEDYSNKARVVVLTDIGNEPDDAQSLVRFLLYTSDYDVEGIFATTSEHLPDETQPEQIHERVAAYATVYPNLRLHHPDYPVPEQLAETVASCQAGAGMAGVGEDWDSEGSQRIIAAMRNPDPRPLWITVWGGANCLAQALWRLEQDVSETELDTLIAKLRVYAISDQDDAGPWLRKHFPGLYYIVSPSADVSDYARSTWSGISGDQTWNSSQLGLIWCIIKQKYGFSCVEPPGGPAFKLVDNRWLQKHIQRGPLGELYPDTLFIMEGDTPSFLNLIDNGLHGDVSPDWGGWGGRYRLQKPAGHPRTFWTDSADTVVDEAGETVTSNRATVWRWREAYQHDFAARIDWTLATSFRDANHAPALSIDGDAGNAVLTRAVSPGQKLKIQILPCDPDGNDVAVTVWHYVEAGSSPPDLKIEPLGEGYYQIGIPDTAGAGSAHVIIEALDDGKPSLRSYRRLVLDVSGETPSH